MNKIKMPKRIHGEWIWKSNLAGREDAFLLLRKSFELNNPGLENNLWISAGSSYGLYINGRFAGFGPRAHHGDANYVDWFDVTRDLQSGVNSIAVIVHYNPDTGFGRTAVPGLWCQLEGEGKLLLASDRSWLVRDLSAFAVPRPRAAGNQLMTEFIDNLALPERWADPMFHPGREWSEPDLCVRPDAPGAQLVIHPLAPPTVDSLIEAELIAAGTIEGAVAWTQVVFGDRQRNRRKVSAAETFLYWDRDEELPVRAFADDPTRFFCNKTLLAGEARMNGDMLKLPLKRGWNRLMVVQLPGASSMGFFLLLPGRKAGSVTFYASPSERASGGWRVAGPLKLSLRDATASLRFDLLQTTEYQADPMQPADVSSILGEMRFVRRERVQPGNLLSGEFAAYKLDSLRYGFPVVELEASAGDMIDLTTGYRPGPNGLPSRGQGVRASHTLRCREGLNRFMLFNPRETLHLLLSVRHAKAAVRIISVTFEELVRIPQSETLFASSDPVWNRLWEVGVQTLRRSSAFIPQNESHAEYDVYLFDAYIDAINMAVTFGDHAYAAARLRQFVDAQFENGDIPVLTFSNRHRSQLHQLFFFPVWMLYNYRVSADRKAMESLLPALELLYDFFQSLIDEETGLLREADRKFGLRSRLSQGEFLDHSIPTYLNALYCRFLLSQAEIYRIVGNSPWVERCLLQAEEMAERLRKYNFDPAARLFVRQSIPDRDLEPDYNLFANFTALFGGVLALEEFEHFFFTFFQTEAPYDRSEEARSPYFHFLFMETMFALGQGAWACNYFREYWSHRICPESGCWLTWRGVSDPAPVRYFEGNVVSPNVFIVREIAGIRPAEAGHATVYFNPALAQADWVDLSLPTACGKLRVRWRKHADGQLDVLLDATYPVKVLPELSADQLRNTAFELGENVTLLQPPGE